LTFDARRNPEPLHDGKIDVPQRYSIDPIMGGERSVMLRPGYNLCDKSSIEGMSSPSTATLPVGPGNGAD